MSTFTQPHERISGKDHDRRLEDHEGTVRIGGRTITNLRFADDVDGLAGEEEELANYLSVSTKPSQQSSKEEYKPWK